MKDRICGVIVTYNCGKEFLKTVESVRHQVETIVIVDNGSDSETIEVLRNLSNEKNIEVIFLDENAGIAAALNKGVKYAIENRYDWILTMDHDSILKNDMVKKLLDGYYSLEEEKMKTVVSLIPKYVEMAIDVEQQLREDSDNIIKYIEQGIASGNLVKIEAFKKVGLFDEKLFIDFVDYDFCYRLRVCGLEIIEVSNAILFHRLGEIKEVKFFHKRPKVTNHSPIRKYYITRNRMYCWDKYRDIVPEEIKKDKGYAMEEIVKVALYEKDRFNKLNMMLKGYLDYKRNRFGKYKG